MVEIVGTTGLGKFAPIVMATSVKVIGEARMPAARLAGAAQLAGGSLDSQWAMVKGLVRTATPKSIWGRQVLVLELDIGGGTLVTARILDFSGDRWRQLPGAIVALHGVCGTVFNDRRQYIGSRFFVSSLEDVQVLRRGPADLFDRPLQGLSSIARFSSGSAAFLPIKVRGTVTYSPGDDRLYLQDGSEGVLVQTTQGGPIGLGLQVEVVGYAREGDYAPSLEGATLRVLNSSGLPKPVAVSASKVIVEKDGFFSSPYDSLLVRLSGVLMQVIPGTDERILSIQDGKSSFTARLSNAVAIGSLPAVGSVVEVTGVCATRVDNAREPRGFKLLLRSPSDVVVVKQAPWWTAQHAKAVVALMGVALVVMAVFLWFFRREAALRQLSLRDPLTGVHNRRGFVLLAEKQWRMARRHNMPMLVFYIDVDNFKQINDTFGHKQGDVALQRVATLLGECFRRTDIIGRLGGDEFAVVACHAHSQSTARLRERLTDIVEHGNRKSVDPFRLSLSVGVHSCDQSMASLGIEDLLAQTDALMYAQKAHRKAVERKTSHITVPI